MIPESFIEELKYASGIEQVVSSYVGLKRRGRNLLGLCPFHSEKTPSFTVYPENQSYYCFGCGAGGDVITFIRQVENLEYVEAIKFLAEKAGMTVPEDAASDQAARQKALVLEINRETARYFYKCLTSPLGKPTLDYLLNRGLTPKTIKKFGLGFAPDTWDSLRKHLRGKGFSEGDMLLAAVVQKGRNDSCYDAFRGRVMFPIIDLRGNVIGFGGRIMEGKGPKYLNSPDTPVFKKSRNLFALNFAKASKSETLILGEGYMDVIAMHQAGFDNAVATLGTSLTAEQSRLIAQYAQKVAIAYDSDSAGQTAAKRAINLFGQTSVQVSVLEIQGAKDPDEYIKKFGAARFEKLVTGSKAALTYEIDKLKKQHDVTDPEGKVQFLGAFCRLMAGVEDAMQREVYIGEVARELDIRREQILSTVGSMRKRKATAARKKEAHNLAVFAQDNSGTPGKPKQITGIGGYLAEEKLLALMLRHPDYFPPVADKIEEEDFLDEDHQVLFALLAGRILDNQPLELIHLSAHLTPKRMGRLSQILLKARELQFYPEQAAEYIGVIKAQKQTKSKKEIGSMSPEEHGDFLAEIIAKKQRNNHPGGGG